MVAPAGFRGASAEAVAALTDQVGGVAQDKAEVVATDLFSVADTLRAEGALRRYATDGTVPTEARTGIIGEVFGGKVDGVTAELLTAAAGRRWTRTRDLADALEHLGVVAAVRAAGDDSDRLVSELFAVRSTVGDSSDLRNALSDPARSVADKAQLVDSLLGSKALPATVLLVKQSLAGTYRTVTAALEAFEKVAASVHGQRVATVHVARPLADGEQQRLADALSRQYGVPVHLNVVVDPAVLGGMRVEIGDDVIDGTVSSRLDVARRSLAG